MYDDDAVRTAPRRDIIADNCRYTEDVDLSDPDAG